MTAAHDDIKQEPNEQPTQDPGWMACGLILTIVLIAMTAFVMVALFWPWWAD